MRSRFPAYYRPTEPEFEKLWRECIFSVDANVLLHIYRRKPATRKEIISVLKGLGDRLWIPYQAALEFQKNKIGVIADQIKIFEDTKNRMETFAATFEDFARKNEHHPLIDFENLRSSVSDLKDQSIRALEQQRTQFPDLYAADTIAEELNFIDGNAIGGELDWNEDKILEEAKRRQAARIPPGYADSEKPGLDRLGDLKIWLQLIAKGREGKRSLIFVTDDAKEDWWHIHQKRTIGPHPLLMAEFTKETGQQFYMYNFASFLDHYKRYLKRPVEQGAIDEIRSEEQRREQNRFDQARSRVLATLDTDISLLEEKRKTLSRMLKGVEEEIASLSSRIDQMNAIPISDRNVLLNSLQADLKSSLEQKRAEMGEMRTSLQEIDATHYFLSKKREQAFKKAASQYFSDRGDAAS